MRARPGSQTTFNNGRAVVEAAIDVREQLLELAAERLEVAADDLELVDGQVRVKRRARTSASTIAELAGSGATLLRQGVRPRSRSAGCDARRAASAGWGSSRSSRRS